MLDSQAPFTKHEMLEPLSYKKQIAANTHVEYNEIRNEFILWLKWSAIKSVHIILTPSAIEELAKFKDEIEEEIRKCH